MILALFAFGNSREPVACTFGGRWWALMPCHFGCCRVWREYADIDERIKDNLHPVGLLAIEVDPAIAPAAS